MNTKWISVNDKLPDMKAQYMSDNVLACVEVHPEDMADKKLRYVSIECVYFNSCGQGFFCCERDYPNGEPSRRFVTHWMPLPELPKEDNQ